MKKTLILLFALIMTCCISTAALAYGYGYGYGYRPQRHVYAYLGMNLEAGANQSGGGLGLTSAREGDLQFETWLDYRYVATTEGNGSSVCDVMIGGAYFPEDPIFSILDSPVRLKISALGGLGMGNDMFFSLLFRADLVFAGRYDSGGLTMGCGFRPGVDVGTTHIPNEVTFNVGFLFSPIG